MDLQPQNQKLDFPVSFRLKIISIIHDTEDSAYKRFEKILDRNKIEWSDWDCRPSSGGKYASYRVNVTIRDEKTFRNLYSELGALEGIKCVI